MMTMLSYKTNHGYMDPKQFSPLPLFIKIIASDPYRVNTYFFFNGTKYKLIPLAFPV